MQQHGVLPLFSMQATDPALTFQLQLNQPHQASDTRYQLDYSLVQTELLYTNHKGVQKEDFESLI